MNLELDNDQYKIGSTIYRRRFDFAHVVHFKRDEFYAYDDELRIYLGEELYSDYFKMMNCIHLLTLLKNGEH